MKNKPFLLLAGTLAFLLSFPVGLNAGVPGLKKPHPLLRSFSVAQGLPSSETYFVHQDRNGYIWFCTDRGVVRYDGYRMKTFTQESGLVSNTVFYVYEDYKGRLWFVSASRELCYYEGGRIRKYRYNHLLRSHITATTGPQKDLFVDPLTGNLTLSVYNGGSVRISPEGKVSYPKNNPVSFVIWEKNGETHFYASRGVPWKYANGKSYCPIYVDDDDGRHYCGVMSVSFGFRVQRYGDAVFVSTRGGLLLIRKKKIISIPVEAPVIALCVIDGNLWLGLYEKGVRKYRMNARGDRLIELDRLLAGKSVSWIAKDREGGFWFSTLEGGVRYAPYINIRHYTARDGLARNNITSLDGVGDHLVAVCNYRQLQDIGSPDSRVVWNGNANAVLGSFREKVLVSWSNWGRRPKYPPVLQEAPSSCQRRRISVNDSYFLSANDNGILRYDGKGGVEKLLHTSYANPLYQPFSVFADNKDRLYIANNTGLFRIRDGKIVPALNGRLNDVNVVDTDYHPVYGSLAVTRGKGLVLFDGERIVRSLTTADGLLSNQLDFCYIDKAERLWVGSHKGLNCVTREGDRFIVKQLTVKNGLLTNEVNAVYAHGERIWIASKKGLTELEPGSEKAAPASEVFLEEIRASSVGKVTQPSPVFESGTTFVKILFRTTNYRGARFHRFRYRLGSESEWAVSSGPEIVLNSPKYGDYRLEVSWLDESGSWSRPKWICSFAIDSPFYLKWYFFAGIGTLLLALGFLVFRLRIRQLSRRHQLHKTINQLEQKALRAQMNPHFIFNSLNSIQSFLVYEENEKAERYLLKFAQLIRQTLNNSRESYIPIRTEIETLQPYLELEQMRFKDKFGFSITCKLSQDELLYGVPPMLIQPFVENAVLHGFRAVESGGNIAIVFESIANNRLLCTVEDNGVGRSATLKADGSGHKSFGTKITAERLEAFREKYGDDFSIRTIDKETDGKPAGTLVVLQIPVVLPHEFAAVDELDVVV
jgi:ligand-binding sensor domain-containing protein